MLKHFNCISVDKRFKAKPTDGGVAPSASTTAAETTADNPASTNGSATNESTSACASVLPGNSASASLSSGHLISLPQGSTHVGVTFRLFASTGKLLAHIEDDLELFTTADGLRSAGSVTRLPITFNLPVEDELVEQRHSNNSFFDRCLQHGRSANAPPPLAPVSRLASATTTSSSSSLTLSTVCSIKTPPSARCCRYYGSACAMLREFPETAPGNSGINNRSCGGCYPEPAPVNSGINNRSRGGCYPEPAPVNSGTNNRSRRCYPETAPGNSGINNRTHGCYPETAPGNNGINNRSRGGCYLEPAPVNNGSNNWSHRCFPMTAPGNNRGNNRSRCGHTGTARRLRTDNRSVLVPVLLELDGLSGRTVPIGCVPSVPVARSRLLTHKADSNLKMSYVYGGQ